MDSQNKDDLKVIIYLLEQIKMLLEIQKQPAYFFPKEYIPLWPQYPPVTCKTET